MASTDTTQETMMSAEPRAEHAWLQKLVGDWTYEGEAEEPGGNKVKSSGAETVRSIGGLWVVAEGSGEMAGGGPDTTIMTLGFDPEKGRFVGTWIGSMMTYLWVYDGSLEGNTLTLEAEGPSFTGDGTFNKYHDVIEFKSNDHRTLTALVLGADGKWQQFMTTHYRRK